MKHVRALILDMDGVLWRGEEVLGDLSALFERLQAMGLKTVFVTNNATRSVAQYVARLRALGLAVGPERILNSAQAAAYALQNRLPRDAWVYVLGEEGLRSTLREAGFRIANKETKKHGRMAVEPDAVQAVVVALDRQCTYDDLKAATLLVRRGAYFLGTNPDRTYPTPQGLVPGAGTLIAALEAATGRQADIAGKPQPLLFRLALQRLGTRPEETLVVGDRLETDIAGGQAAGCLTAVVLSGVTSEEEALRWEPAPDLIVPDLTALVTFLERERRMPGRRVAKEEH